MLALAVALLATVILSPETVAAQDDYTVWASVIFSRTGERTPEVLGYIPTTLTSLGAQQAYESGAFFRSRYISSVSIIDGIDSAPLQGLSAESIDSVQLYIAALDEQYTVASAQAFVQGLYPPFTLNSSAASMLDPTSVLANGTYVEYPLEGYQYAQVHAFGALDSEFPFLGGSLDCPAFDVSAVGYTSTSEFAATEASSKSTYQTIGAPLLSAVLEDEDTWDYYNAYAIYDYVNYQRAHNASFAALLSEPEYIDPSSNISYFDVLKWYADQQQYAQLGNLTAQNSYTTDGSDWPPAVMGSISTIAGNLLAAKMLAQLQFAIETSGEYYKLSILFGDFEPLMSFFALTGLPDLDSNFYGLPDFGSVAVFELFSNTDNSTDASFPSTDDLWVRFYFRNGTDGSDASGNFQAYPLFYRGPSQTEMTWNDFQTAMYGILLSDVGDWCTQCGAENLFCAAWNTTDGATGSMSVTTSSRARGLSPAVAGAIGGIITLAVAALLFAFAMVLGGVRFHRAQRSHRSELGGFKGGRKMASDKDLTLSKGGAVVGASVERSPDSPMTPIGHERVGSWELKEAEAEAGRQANIADAQSTRRLSFESEDHVDPFRDPVKADERV
ncbi:hypothetical protein LTR36_009148 [Oleoguttula mirabilis]|uniref:Histidine acid phosphatase n=1 Tax=Oleoguttula mirabilis TaxID=1507867 RepID=A0AAV9J6E4_9PEZI|nr:hypothetical protein LTR36_009148 [Oleoguttula mirabilis]